MKLQKTFEWAQIQVMRQQTKHVNQSRLWGAAGPPVFHPLIVPLLLAMAAVLMSPKSEAHEGLFTDAEFLYPAETEDSSDEWVTDVATDGAGNWVVGVMRVHPIIVGYRDIYVMRSADAGITWSDPVPLNTDLSGYYYSLVVTTDGLGNWVAIWYMDNKLLTQGVQVSRSTDAGATWSAPEWLSGDVCLRPQVATDGAGNWVAVWSSFYDPPSSDWDILVARSTDAGATWSVAEPLNNDAATDIVDDRYPLVVTDRDGTWLVGWEHKYYYITTDGNRLLCDAVVSRSTDAGLTWSDPCPLTNAAADYADGNAYDNSSPQLAADGAGHWVAVWTRGGNEGLMTARSEDGGITWSDPAHVYSSGTSEPAPQSDSGATVTTDGLGNWLVLWTSKEAGNDYPDIFVCRSRDNGATWSTPLPVNSSYATYYLDDTGSHVATDGLGNWVVLWNTSRGCNSENEQDWPGGCDADIMVAKSVHPEVVVSHPSSSLINTGPVTFTIEYPDAESITLSASDISLLSTGTATGTVSLIDNGDNTRTVTIDSISGTGTLSLSIASGTARGILGTLADAFTSSYLVFVFEDPLSVPLRWWPLALVLGVIALSTLLRIRRRTSK